MREGSRGRSAAVVVVELALDEPGPDGGVDDDDDDAAAIVLAIDVRIGA